MSTDNSKILRNELKRSFFTQHKPVYTSQKIGNVAVSSCSLALPSETQKLISGTYYELKPLANRLSTQIKANQMGNLVYIRDIWDNWDKFLAKGKLMVRNGAFNVPYIEAENENTNYNLPFVFVRNIINGLLSSGFGSCAKMYQPTYRQRLPADSDGNKLPYDFDFYTQIGRYFKSTQNTDISRYVDKIGWWLPRLIGKGVTTSGVNCRLVEIDRATSTCEMYLNISKPEIVQLAKIALIANYTKIADDANLFLSPLFDISKFNQVSIGVSEYGGAVFYSLALSSSFATATDRNNWNNNNFAIFSTTQQYQNHPTFAYIGVNEITDIPSNYRENTASTLTIKDDNGILPLFLVGSDSPMKELLAATIVTALFENSELLGNGSLMEQMGHSIFENISIYDIIAKYCPFYTGAPIGFQPDAVFPIVNYDIVDNLFDNLGLNPPSAAQKVNILPYVAYQKVCTERFLLPHQVLSNNEGNDSTLNDKLYDSPYWRVNMIPTKLYGQIYQNDLDYIQSNTMWGYEGSEFSAGTSREDFEPEVWNHAVGLNQFLAIFFNRGTLLDMDVFTRIWQKQDRNLQTLLQTAAVNITDNNDIMQAKKFAITKALTRYSLFGQLDQMITSVLENHYGITAKSENGRSIALNKVSRTLPTLDIFNTGGSVDAQGNSQILGERTNVVSKNYEPKKVYEVFADDFAYLINLHWFSVPTTRQNVPNGDVHLFEKLSSENDVRFAFQLALFPEFQNTGDELLKLDDVEVWADSVPIAWTNKNNTLKDGFAQMAGEFKTNRFKRQIVTPYPSYHVSNVAPSLSYAYLMPTPYDYDLPLVDRFGDAFLIEFDNTIVKNSPMTKNGLIIS